MDVRFADGVRFAGGERRVEGDWERRIGGIGTLNTNLEFVTNKRELLQSQAGHCGAVGCQPITAERSRDYASCCIVSRPGGVRRRAYALS